MPPGLLDLFGAAARTAEATTIEWQGPSGARHRFRCGVAAVAAPAPVEHPVAAPPPADFSRLQAAPVARAVTDQGDAEAAPSQSGGAASDRQAGILVHRLMERSAGRDVRADDVRAWLPELVGADLLPADAAEREALAVRAAAAYGALAGQPELAALLASGDVHHEVPFSVRAGGELRRGILDCLVRTPTGAVTVIEFKTGRPRVEHQRQIALYRTAAERLFPGTAVDVRLFYSGE